MKYTRRETEIHSVDAIQFLGIDSVERIREEFGVCVNYDADRAEIVVGSGVIAERGDYVIAVGFSVAVKKAEWFEKRFRPIQKQLEMEDLWQV